MTFQIKKIADVGTSNPIVARLGMQTSELIKWLNLEKKVLDDLTELYVTTLTERLLHCDRIFLSLVQEIEKADAEIKPPQSGGRVIYVPHVPNLRTTAESYLYECKNYLRDLLGVLQLVYDCKLRDASDFVDLKRNGDSNLVKWASNSFGDEYEFTRMLRTEQEWVSELIRKRNAVEPPNGFSGSLEVLNIETSPVAGKFYFPRWSRSGNPSTDIARDMEVGNSNMLTLAEDILVNVIMDKSHFKKQIQFYEIEPYNRDKDCPIRLKISLNEELLKKFPRSGSSPSRG